MSANLRYWQGIILPFSVSVLLTIDLISLEASWLSPDISIHPSSEAPSWDNGTLGVLVSLLKSVSVGCFSVSSPMAGCETQYWMHCL